MKETGTVIVGGGIAGLGCARTLIEAGYLDFELVTENIGGRICYSQDGKVSYGSYYIRNDYEHLLPFVKLGRRFRAGDFGWWQDGRVHSVSTTIRSHPIALARLIWQLGKFNQAYQLFKKQSTHLPQRELIESDRWTQLLYKENSIDFIKRHRLTCLEEGLIEPVIWGCALVDYKELNAGNLLFLLLLLVLPAYEFVFDFEKLKKPFQSKISFDQVTVVERTRGKWEVNTRNGKTFCTDNLVAALPIDDSLRLLKLKMEINEPVNASMLHVRGILKSCYNKKRFLAVAPEMDDIILAKQADGSWLVYSRKESIDLNVYFDQWETLGSKHWRPAFRLGTKLIDCSLGDGLYLIGDHNAAAMEDAYITGIFAANSLMKRIQD